MDFVNRVAVVTGGSSGIGLATAKLLVASGAHVWLTARSAEKLAAALQQVEAARRSPEQRCGTVAADVSDAGQAANAVAQVSEAVGLPDLLINAAGVAHPGYFQDLSLEIFHWTMDVDFFGTLNMAKAVVPGMIARRSGHIVNISSMAGFLGVYGYTAYGAAKYAVRGFSDVLRAEMKPYGVKVSVVFPPDTDTPQLTYENQFKPFETRALAGNAKCVSPDVVAKSILNGVRKGRYVIIPGFEGKLAYRLCGLLGDGIYPLMDMMVRQAQKQKANQNGK